MLSFGFNWHFRKIRTRWFAQSMRYTFTACPCSVYLHIPMCVYIFIIILYYILIYPCSSNFNIISYAAPVFIVLCPLQLFGSFRQFFQAELQKGIDAVHLLFHDCKTCLLLVRRRSTVTKSIAPKNIKQNICHGLWWSCHLEELFHKRIEEKGVVPLIKITNFLSIICMHHLILFDHFRHPSITEHITCSEKKHRGHHDACTFLAA